MIMNQHTKILEKKFSQVDEKKGKSGYFLPAAKILPALAARIYEIIKASTRGGIKGSRVAKQPRRCHGGGQEVVRLSSLQRLWWLALARGNWIRKTLTARVSSRRQAPLKISPDIFPALLVLS